MQTPALRRRKLYIACFAAKRQKCAHSAASPLKNANTSFGLRFCIVRCSYDDASMTYQGTRSVVVADLASLAPSKSAALTRLVAPPLQIKPAPLGFDLISIFSGELAPLPFSLGRPVFVDVSSISLVLPQSGKRALIPLRLLSKLQPLRWVVIL